MMTAGLVLLAAYCLAVLILVALIFREVLRGLRLGRALRQIAEVRMRQTLRDMERRR